MKILILRQDEEPEEARFESLYDLIRGLGDETHVLNWESMGKSDRKAFEDDVVELIRDRNFDIFINERAECLPMAELCWEVKKRTGIKILAFFSEEPVECKAVGNWREAFHLSDLTVFPSVSNLYRFAKLINTEHIGLMTTLYPLVSAQVPQAMEKKNLVVYVGRFKPLSAATDLMIKAWATVEGQVDDWELVCIGKGEDIPNAQKKCERRKLKNVSFVGMEDPTEYLDTAKIIVFPEYHNRDVALAREAVARGCVPCYADDTDSEKFAQSILAVMKNPKLHEVKPYTKADMEKQWKYIAGKLLSMSRDKHRSSGSSGVHVSSSHGGASSGSRSARKRKKVVVWSIVLIVLAALAAGAYFLHIQGVTPKIFDLISGIKDAIH